MLSTFTFCTLSKPIFRYTLILKYYEVFFGGDCDITTKDSSMYPVVKNFKTICEGQYFVTIQESQLFRGSLDFSSYAQYI